MNESWVIEKTLSLPTLNWKRITQILRVGRCHKQNHITIFAGRFFTMYPGLLTSGLQWRFDGFIIGLWHVIILICLDIWTHNYARRQITIAGFGSWGGGRHWGYIYHKSYVSLWCDTGGYIGIWNNEEGNIHKSIIFLLIYIGRTCRNDELYKRNEGVLQNEYDNYFKDLQSILTCDKTFYNTVHFW